jgi:hypothetical protein
MKSRRDQAEAITEKLFSACERIEKKDTRPAESIEDFLKRGGKIKIIPERRK